MAKNLIARLEVSPAYRRCLVDLPSVCKRMARRVIHLMELRAASFRPVQEDKGPRLTQEERAAKENMQRQEDAARYADVESIQAYLSASADGAVGIAGEVVTGRDIVQVVFPRIDKVKHENKVSRLAFDEVYSMSVLNDHAAHARKVERKTEAKKQDDKTPYLDGARQRRNDDIANDIIKKVSLKTGNIVRSSNGSKLKPKASLITCTPLFTHGEKDEDGFSRTIALKYLAKRVIFATKSNAKGYDAAHEKATSEPTKLKDRKTSSSQAKLSLYLASDIEDTIQEAFSLYQMASLLGMERNTWTASQAARMEALSKLELKTVANLAKHRTGNRAWDTFAACQRAKNLMTRARHKERKRLNVLAARMKAREDKERGAANRFYDAELDALLGAVNVHGYENQKKLAEVLGIRPDTLCRQLASLRTRLEAQEAREVERTNAARLEMFRDWEKAIAARNWKLAASLESIGEKPQEDARARHILASFPSLPTLDQKRAYARM